MKGLARCGGIVGLSHLYMEKLVIFTWTNRQSQARKKTNALTAVGSSECARTGVIFTLVGGQQPAPLPLPRSYRGAFATPPANLARKAVWPLSVNESSFSRRCEVSSSKPFSHPSWPFAALSTSEWTRSKGRREGVVLHGLRF